MMLNATTEVTQQHSGVQAQAVNNPVNAELGVEYKESDLGSCDTENEGRFKQDVSSDGGETQNLGMQAQSTSDSVDVEPSVESEESDSKKLQYKLGGGDTADERRFGQDVSSDDEETQPDSVSMGKSQVRNDYSTQSEAESNADGNIDISDVDDHHDTPPASVKKNITTVLHKELKDKKSPIKTLIIGLLITIAIIGIFNLTIPILIRYFPIMKTGSTVGDNIITSISLFTGVTGITFCLLVGLLMSSRDNKLKNVYATDRKKDLSRAVNDYYAHHKKLKLMLVGCVIIIDIISTATIIFAPEIMNYLKLDNTTIPNDLGPDTLVPMIAINLLVCTVSSILVYTSCKYTCKNDITTSLTDVPPQNIDRGSARQCE
ncbi:MAG: hypothetical protein ACTJLM_05455 [Ehrlichia sp.]